MIFVRIAWLSARDNCRRAASPRALATDGSGRAISAATAPSSCRCAGSGDLPNKRRQCGWDPAQARRNVAASAWNLFDDHMFPVQRNLEKISCELS